MVCGICLMLSLLIPSGIVLKMKLSLAPVLFAELPSILVQARPMSLACLRKTGSANDNNVGGYFAPFLKFSGWDLLEIQGKAKEDVVIFIDGNKGKVTISESPERNIDTYHFIDKLTEIYADDEKDRKKY